MYIVPTNILNEPCSVVIKNNFSITCGFAITVNKLKEQIINCVIVTLSKKISD